MEILAFELGARRYALPVESVREIVRAVAITPLPLAPGIVEGIVNVRGSIVPVLDIRRRFRLPPHELGLSDLLVIARAGRRIVAVRADGSAQVTRVDAHDVERVDNIVPGAEYVAGIAKLPDGIVLIHDIATFLSDAEAQSLDEAVASAAPGPDAE